MENNSLNPSQQPSQVSQSSPHFSKTFILILGAIALIATSAVGGYFLGTRKSAPPQDIVCTQEALLCPDGSSVGRIPPTCEFVPCPNPTSDGTANWKTYTNNKYSYLIRFPNEYNAEIFNGQSGEYEEAGTNNERMGIYQDRNGPYGGNFLEIQIVPKDKKSSLKELVETNYNNNTNGHFSEDFSPLKPSQIAGNPSYEYSLERENAILYNTDYGLGFVADGKYRVIFTEKNNIIYSIYSTDKDLFNQILSTFKFTP